MKIFCNKAAKFFILLSPAIFAAADASAQKINEDLQLPASTQKKTTTTTKPVQTPKKKPGKIVKKTKTQTTPLTAPTTLPTTNQANTTTTTPVTNPANNSQTETNTQPTVVQTPIEILKRFMDFQQSEGVTTKDWESVVAQSNAALQVNPADATVKAQLFVAQGELAFARGDFSNALIQFHAASDVLPASALPFYGIGKVYLATKQPNEAEEAFQKAIKIDKNFALAYKGMGDAMTAQNKTKRAQDYYKDAARIGLSSGNGVVAQGNQNVGNSQKNQANVPNINTPPYDDELNEAKKLTVRKKWQASLDKIDALSKTYQNADIYIAMGDNYMGMRQLLSAQQSYRKATEVTPDSAMAFYKLGAVLFELNEFQAANEAFEKSLILDQEGTSINRPMARKMADRASEKAKETKEGKKKFLGIG